MRRKLFCGTASETSGGGAERQFRSKKVRAKFRISHRNLLIVRVIKTRYYDPDPSGP